MQNIDFLGVSPSIYLLNKSSGQTKVGGFFSLIYILAMIALIIYYLIIYFSGKEYKLRYLSENLSITEINAMANNSIEIYFYPTQLNFENGNIHFYLEKKGVLYNETNLQKCNEYAEIDPNGTIYCFNMSFGDYFDMECEGNCTDSLTGQPYQLNYQIFVNILKINHNEKNPLTFIKNEKMEFSQIIYTQKNEFLMAWIQYTPVEYKTTNIFKKDYEIYNENFVNNIEYFNSYTNSDSFFGFSIGPTAQKQIYEREYKTLMDTFSDIGGIYSNLQTIFTFLLLFYSRYENNYQIVKNIIIKKNLYQNNSKNNISHKKLNDKSIDFLNIEKNFDKKKVKINSWEHYFCSIFNGRKQKKTMKILNLCNDLVQEYLSAENIIFNSILFERFYEDNPINVNETQILKELENEMFENNNEMDFLLGIT